MDYDKWRLVVGPIDDFSNAALEVTSARQRKFVFSLEAAPTCSFQVDAFGEDAQICWELDHDVILYDDEQRKVFRGRIGGVNENFGTDMQSLDVQAVGYRGLLNRRILLEGDTISFVQKDQSLIAWTLANVSQARPGGALGITRGAGQTTGRLRDREYEYGQICGDLVQQLGEVIDGFDWDVDADLKFNIYYPYRGVEGIALDWGGMVQGVQRNWQSQTYANVLRGAGGVRTVETTGSGGETIKTDYPTIPVIRYISGIGTAPEGRWETGLSWPDIVIQSTLVDHTEAELDYRHKRLADITVTLRPGMWEGPDQVWIGDICTLQSPLRGRLNIPGDLTWRNVRVLEVQINWSDDGGPPGVQLVVAEVILD